MKCAVTGREYRILGHKGKQVRDILHCADLVAAFVAFHRAPRAGAVYNMGGSRFSHCSLLEAVTLCEELTGRHMKASYVATPRVGDHIWWVSDVTRFQADYPEWQVTRNVRDILAEILEYHRARWARDG
jgi:CDP-paratose 2-epimerase